MPLPTLMIRGSLIIPDGTPPAKAEEMRNSIPLTYITNLINNTPATGPGSRVLVLRSATGSGKSTALPVALMPRGRRVGITQPARLTAQETPYDICETYPELKMGENIGYQTGLINRSAPRGINFMTTGILQQQLINQVVTEPERFMRKYSTIIIDEVHRHDMQIDVVLRLLKQFVTKFWNNPDCPFVIIQSATMDPQKYMSYFETALFVDVVGSTFPITKHWAKTPVSNLPQWVTRVCRELSGDTLVFLPGKKQIQAVREALERDRETKATQTIEVMGETVSKGEVKQMMRASKKSRIVLATNAAETGLTLPFLANVIETGLQNAVGYNPQYNCTAIALQPVTQASSTQRAGRVGRKFPGTCYFGYTEDTYKHMETNNTPEMYTSDASGYLLRLIVSLTESKLDDHWQVESRNEFDPATLGLIHAPSQETLCAAYDKLYQLGLIKTNWQPTVSGLIASRMAKSTPETAKMLLSAPYWKADLYKLVIIAACVEMGGIGDLKGFGQDLYDDRTRCGFIRQLVAFEQLRRRINKMTVKHMSTNYVEEWCADVGIGYVSALRIIERVYELVFELMGMGLRVDLNKIPLLDTLEANKKEDTLTEIRAIKACIVEGYRLNMCTWNDRMSSYVGNYKHALLTTREKFAAGPPLYIVTDSITYTGAFSIGNLVCQLDEHITADPSYMY